MKKCSNCGRMFEVLHPELWAYKDGKGFNVKDWYCRYNCMQEYRKRKEAEKMARMKKNGTPAQKPGRKPRVETAEKLPDMPKVELVYDESIAEEYKREQEAKKAEEKTPVLPTVELIRQMDEEVSKLRRQQKEEMAERIRPEIVRNVINGVEMDDAQVAAIRVKDLGVFFYDMKYGTIDWRNSITGEEISLTPADWEMLAVWIPKMLKVLGADD